MTEPETPSPEPTESEPPAAPAEPSAAAPEPDATPPQPTEAPPQPTEAPPQPAEEPAQPAQAPPQPTAVGPATPAAQDTPDAPPPAAEPVAPAPAAEAPAPAPVVPATTPQPAVTRPAKAGTHSGLGRRKSSVARVRLLPGDGKITINKRELDSFFTQIQDRNAVTAPLEATESRSTWDVVVNVRGGGPSGQSGAIRLGLARALVSADESFEATLRDAGYLTRDARRVERKKPGRRKARRSFQFSKR